MAIVNSGSISLNIYNSISPLSNNISGLLLTIVEQNVFYVEQFTGASIPVSSIDEQYQLPITNLATANILKLMAVQDNGVNSVSVGDLTTENSNLITMAQSYQDLANTQLKQLTNSFYSFKARG